MYQKPTNVEELADFITALELKSMSLKEEIETTSAVFMDNLKPMNLLKNAWQHITQGIRDKVSVKILPGPKKLLRRPMDVKTPILLSNS